MAWEYALAAVLIAALLGSSIVVVRHNERGVIETMGRYARTAAPGLVFVLPFLQSVRRVDLGDRTLTMGIDDVRVADGAAVDAELVLRYAVIDAREYCYSVLDHELALRKLLEFKARRELAVWPAPEIKWHMREIESAVCNAMSGEVTRWGIAVHAVDLRCDTETQTTRLRRDRPG